MSKTNCSSKQESHNKPRFGHCLQTNTSNIVQGFTSWKVFENPFTMPKEANRVLEFKVLELLCNVYINEHNFNGTIQQHRF